HHQVRPAPAPIEVTCAGTQSGRRQFLARKSREQADVVVRTGVHAIEAERAVEIADLAWLEEIQLAAALHDRSGERRGLKRADRSWFAMTPDTVLGPAIEADVRIAHRDLQ